MTSDELTANEIEDEGSFSWSPCDICGNALGGLRYDAHAWLDGKLVHLSGCVDCLIYISNGDEPPQEDGEDPHAEKELNDDELAYWNS